MAKSTKPVRPSRAKKPPRLAAETPTDDAPVDEAARYTWAQLRATVKPPSDEALALYKLRAPRSELVSRGAKLRSERVLTDLRLWLGQIVDWWRRLPAKRRAEVALFSEDRLRVIAHHAFSLYDLVERAGARNKARVDHAEAVAKADTAFREAQRARQVLRLALDQAAEADGGFGARVDAADEPSDNDAEKLQRTLGSLIDLARGEMEKRSDVGRLLAADGAAAALTRGDIALKALKEAHESTRGAAPKGPVTQTELDALDGACLTYMGHLRAAFRALKEDDPSAPTLVPRATASVFGVHRQRNATATTEKEPAKEPAKEPEAGG